MEYRKSFAIIFSGQNKARAIYGHRYQATTLTVLLCPLQRFHYIVTAIISYQIDCEQQSTKNPGIYQEGASAWAARVCVCV